MGIGTPDPADDPGQSSEERWSMVHSLTKGDTIRLNGQERSVIVSKIDRQANEEGLTRVSLEGVEREYTISTMNGTIHAPLITWPSAAHSTIVHQIRPAGETIISTTRVSDISTIPVGGDHMAEDLEQPTGQSHHSDIDKTTIIGSCPLCNSVVVADRQRAICVACRSWCWIDQWDGHYDQPSNHTRLPKKVANLETVQLTLDEDW